MRGLAFLLLVLAIAGTALGCVGIAYAVIEDTIFLAPSIAVLVLPWVLWLLVRNRAADEGRAAYDAALRTISADESGWYKGSGIALDRTAGKLLVASRGEVAVQPVGALTAVHFVPESAGSVSAAGMSNMGILGAILALFAVSSATAGHLGSGLFVTLGGRTWQVFGLSKTDAEAWIARLRESAPDVLVKEQG